MHTLFGIPGVKRECMETSKNPVICYCAGITRDEIRQAVMMGARREEEVRLLTGKLEKGNCCKENHHQGICCHEDFKHEDFKKEMATALMELEATARALFGFG